MTRTPASYKPAKWHCTLPHDAAQGVVGIGLLQADGSLARFALDTESARKLADTLAAVLPSKGVDPAGVRDAA